MFRKIKSGVIVLKKIIKFFDYFFGGCAYLVSKKIVVILFFILFIGLLTVNAKYHEELILKENDVLYEKTNPEISYYNEKVSNINYGENSAITDWITCYQKQINLNEIPQNVSNHINELNNLYNQSNKYYSFFYQDLFSGFTVAYNESSPIFTASSIKAPAMIYLYEMASLGKVNLDEELVYTGNFFSEGSGILKTKEVGTKYRIEDLIYYAIHYSDNIAYRMLMNRFSQKDILDFWTNLGTEHIFTQSNTIWGNTSAKDASIYMKELYRFYKENDVYGSKLMEYFKDAEWKLVTNKNGEFNTASKGGWSGTAIHDATIVFDKNPYILVIMSHTGESDYNYLFKNTSEIVGKLHEEYWKYKVEICSNITQY